MQDEIKEGLEGLLEFHSESLSNWEIKFCGDMIQIIDDGYILTEAQLSTAEEMIEKHS